MLVPWHTNNISSFLALQGQDFGLQGSETVSEEVTAVLAGCASRIKQT